MALAHMEGPIAIIYSQGALAAAARDDIWQRLAELHRLVLAVPKDGCNDFPSYLITSGCKFGQILGAPSTQEGIDTRWQAVIILMPLLWKGNGHLH